MAVLGGGVPNSSSFPRNRFTHTNPLRREFGLRLLSEALPEPLRTGLIRAWRRPPRFDGKEAIQSLHRQRPDDALLLGMPPRMLCVIALTELEVSRRVVEAPLVSISRETCNRLLADQGHYLWGDYQALARQIGEAAAQVVFQQEVDSVR